MKDIIEKIKEMMKSKTLLIADGHHRYETSRLYKEDMDMENPGNPEDIFLPFLFLETRKIF